MSELLKLARVASARQLLVLASARVFMYTVSSAPHVSERHVAPHHREARGDDQRNVWLAHVAPNQQHIDRCRRHDRAHIRHERLTHREPKGIGVLAEYAVCMGQVSQRHGESVRECPGRRRSPPDIRRKNQGEGAV